jgi:hypothetical protein
MAEEGEGEEGEGTEDKVVKTSPEAEAAETNESDKKSDKSSGEKKSDKTSDKASDRTSLGNDAEAKVRVYRVSDKTTDKTALSKTAANANAKSKHRSVCPTMLKGDRCGDGSCNFRHLRVCDMHTSATQPRDCRLWHFRSLLSNPSGGTTGNSSGHPRILSNVEISLQKRNDRLNIKNDKLKKHVETLADHSQKRKEKEKMQRSYAATLMPQQMSQQQTWQGPPAFAAPASSATLVPDMLAMSGSLANLATLVQHMQQQMAILAAR